MKLLGSAAIAAIAVGMLCLGCLGHAEETESVPQPVDLGPPLVDNAKDLKQFGKYAGWLDVKNKQVVLVGKACKASYPLEFFITSSGRDYESAIVIEGGRPAPGQLSIFQQIETSLILLGAKSGKPAFYKDGKTTVATGDEIAIEIRWKDKDGKIQKTDARECVRYIKTKKPPEKNWVFAGSGFLSDGEGGKRFMADGGEFVCVLNNPLAMLDLPIVSSSAIEERSFEANSDKMPPGGTAVTILLTPKPAAKR